MRAATGTAAEITTMRVGVIGSGGMGRRHARVYSELGVDLVGIADTDKETVGEIAGLYNTRAFTNYEELLGEDLDAVSVVVPTRLHSEIALSAISHGANLLVEKPIADSIENASRIIDSAHDAGLVLMVGHIERFNPVVQELMEIVEQGVLGDLITLSSRRVGPFVERVTDIGIAMDVASHDIDIARYLTGREAVDVVAKSTRLRHEKGDCALIIIDLEGTTALIEVNWFTPHKVRTLAVTGTRGIAYADYIKQELVVYNSAWKLEPKIDKEEPLRAELRHFLECVQSGREPLVTGEDGLRTLEIALKVEEG